MGTRGLIIVRFNRRYYARYNHSDSYFEALGSWIVAEIPTDPEEYRAWLVRTRAEYAALERDLENEVYELRDDVDSIPDSYHGFRDFVEFPSELPSMPDVGAQYTYITNLDQEILTMNGSIHWKLSNIPRQGNLWLHAIKKSIHKGKLTISSETCPEEHMASPALAPPTLSNEIKYNYRLVVPEANIEAAPKMFLTYVLSRVLKNYQSQITQFAMEWTAESFPFRELCFAFVSIASGKARFHPYVRRRIQLDRCIDREWAQTADERLPIPFGAMFHRPGEPPGVSPVETIYWLDDVLVSLTRVPDGTSVTRAVSYGVGQGRNHFQIVILSIFEVILAEVLLGDENKPFVKVSKPIKLSPLRMDYCTSFHPRERPEAETGMKRRRRRGELIMMSHCRWTVRTLGEEFLGFAALVNFFEVAGNRRAATKSSGRLPTELYEQILDFVDHETWINCLDVSRQIRYLCLRRFRLDHQMRIVTGPSVLPQEMDREHLPSFDAENIQSGRSIPIMAAPSRFGPRDDTYNWIPEIGNDLKMAMEDVVIQFGLQGEVSVGSDSPTWTSDEDE
ncbi:F-box domain-containing protein [Metarhizium guizhouense ARSEF 977]|uniref:F-box domain-containing protein n=1 Tax=Metarhizium guizhouense (strain ARSEF 977) TaxID=1276136 RepID=A0A0B4GKV8_METGA|nr:F-box domain-containing protein [Metarhizium guizhouense ARSEF 977]KID83761.1 F-box domain-containing protein [Metarhizium guizhouense ARSEF 977]